MHRHAQYTCTHMPTHTHTHTHTHARTHTICMLPSHDTLVYVHLHTTHMHTLMHTLHTCTSSHTHAHFTHRVWEKLKEGMQAIGANVTGLKRMIADWAKQKGLQGNTNIQNK